MEKMHTNCKVVKCLQTFRLPIDAQITYFSTLNCVIPNGEPIYNALLLNITSRVTFLFLQRFSFLFTCVSLE